VTELETPAPAPVAVGDWKSLLAQLVQQLGPVLLQLLIDGLLKKPAASE
jgi:hypothetical protein